MVSEIPSSKSSSQLSVCSSGGCRENDSGGIWIFSASCGCFGAAFHAPELELDGDAVMSRIGDGGRPFVARAGCLDGRDGDLSASFHSCTFSTASS